MPKEPIGTDLWYDPEASSVSVTGTKEDVTLYLAQEVWQPDEDDVFSCRSYFQLVADGLGAEVRLPVESARQLYHALGAVLEEDEPQVKREVVSKTKGERTAPSYTDIANKRPAAT